MTSFKDSEHVLTQRVQNARIREEARLRADLGYEQPEDDRLLAGNTNRQRTADRHTLRGAGILETIEYHVKQNALYAMPGEWDEDRWAAGSTVGR